MGAPKQLMPWGDSTLLGHAVDTAVQLPTDKVGVVLGANSEEIKETITHDRVVVFEHPQWEDGLGTSIAYGVTQLFVKTPQIDGVLILLADQPLISLGYLHSIIRGFELGKQQIIATSYDEKKQGVPALFDKFYLDELTKLKGDKGAKKILQKYSAKVTLHSAEGQLADIDTLDDYRTLYMANHQW